MESGKRGRVSFKCTISLASYRIIVNTDYTRCDGNEGRTAAPLIANWLRCRNNTGEPVTLRFLLQQVRYGYSFSLFTVVSFATALPYISFLYLNVRVRSTSFLSFFFLFLLFFQLPLFTFSLLCTFLCNDAFVEKRSNPIYSSFTFLCLLLINVGKISCKIICKFIWKFKIILFFSMNFFLVTIKMRINKRRNRDDSFALLSRDYRWSNDGTPQVSALVSGPSRNVHKDGLIGAHETGRGNHVHGPIIIPL